MENKIIKIILKELDKAKLERNALVSGILRPIIDDLYKITSVSGDKDPEALKLLTDDEVIKVIKNSINDKKEELNKLILKDNKVVARSPYENDRKLLKNDKNLTIFAIELYSEFIDTKMSETELKNIIFDLKVKQNFNEADKTIQYIRENYPGMYDYKKMVEIVNATI